MAMALKPTAKRQHVMNCAKNIMKNIINWQAESVRIALCSVLNQHR